MSPWRAARPGRESLRPADPRGLVALIQRLQHRWERDRSGLLHVEGIAGVLRAHAAGVPFEAVLHDPVLIRSPAAEKFVRKLRKSGVPTWRVPPETFRAASFTTRASGLAAVVRQRWTPLDQVDPGRGTCWLVLERIRSPGNLGTILRTAEAAGAGGAIFLDTRCDPHHPLAVRSSMGGVFGLELSRATPDGLARWAAARGVQLVATSPSARELHTEARLAPPVALLVGDEREGLSERARAICGSDVRIPVLGRGDSLNVAVAAGVVLYEVLRRRA